MKTIELKLYKFEELTEDAQEKAIENNLDINADYAWWESVYIDAENVGLKITEFDIDRGSYCNCEFVENAADVAKNIIENHGTDCDTCKDSESFLTVFKPLNEKLDNEFLDDLEIEEEIEDLENEYLYTLSEDYRIILQREYEYLTSEEYIKDTLIANEYDFTEDGEIY